jgi:hypothetical protein
LAKRIGEIVEKNDLNWEEWPGMERMEVLCIRASGLFIWAATVVKFFQEQINALGRECLNDLLDAVSTDGMDDINSLYGAILRIVYKGRKNHWEFETFRRVVGCIVVLQEPLCLAEIENLLDLRQNTSSERVDIQRLVRRLRTVLVPGTDAINGQTIPDFTSPSSSSSPVNVPIVISALTLIYPTASWQCSAFASWLV